MANNAAGVAQAGAAAAGLISAAGAAAASTSHGPSCLCIYCGEPCEVRYRDLQRDGRCWEAPFVAPFAVLCSPRCRVGPISPKPAISLSAGWRTRALYSTNLCNIYIYQCGRMSL